MEVIAQTNQIRISPRKVRLVADAIRDLPMEEAVAVLNVVEKRGASILKKTLASAIANAVNNAKLDRTLLTIARIEVTDGPALKRYHASTRGRIHPYKRRSSNIRIVLKEREVKSS